MGKAEIEAFLRPLAVQGQVAASTQNQLSVRCRVSLTSKPEVSPGIAVCCHRQVQQFPATLSEEKLWSQVQGS